MHTCALAAQAPAVPARLKWLVLLMLALATFLNYVDRQILALLARPIQDALGMDDQGYSLVVTVFMFAYMLGNLSSGLLIDRVGAQRALPLFLLFWSSANALSGLAHNTEQLAVTRFLLGIAETGGFIAAPILVGLYFPPREVALGVGVYTAAAMLGAAVSPPAVTGLYALLGWRIPFFITGLAGILLAMAWIAVLGWRTQAPRAATAGRAATVQAGAPALSWRRAVLMPRVWAYVAGTTLTFPVWYFYLNWFPKYLTDERGLSTLEMGSRAWVVYLFAGIGCMVGGALSNLLIRRGVAPLTARLRVMGVACLLAPVGIVNYFAPAVEISLAAAAAVALIHMVWQTTITSLPLDLFPARDQGKVYAVAGIGSGLAGMGSTWLIGQAVGQLSYRPMFLIMGFCYLLALGAVVLLVRRGAAGSGEAA